MASISKNFPFHSLADVKAPPRRKAAKASAEMRAEIIAKLTKQ